MTRECRTQKELDAALQGADVPVLVGSGSFRVGGNARVEAWGSSRVVAWGSSHVVARGSSHVVAAKLVSVHIHGSPSVSGGLQIPVVLPRNLAEWCDFYGATREDGIVLLYKGVRDDYRSGYGFLYAVGSTPVCPDWDGGERECGGGFHLCAHPSDALFFDGKATRFLACPVAEEDIAVHPDAEYPSKVKVRRICQPIYEVDRYGNRMAKEDK